MSQPQQNRLPVKQMISGGIQRFFTLPDSLEVHPKIARSFKRNFFANTGDNTFWFFGESFAAYNTIMPVYFSIFTSSPLLIGLIPSIRDACWFLPQLFLAPRVEKLDRKMPLITWLAIQERVTYLALALAALWLPTLKPNLAVIIFLVLWLWKSIAAGLTALPWQELIAKVIPVSHRGRYFGFSYLMGSLTRVVGASLASLVLARVVYPKNYALSFAIAFIGMSISFGFLLLNDEPAIKEEDKAEKPELPFREKISKVLLQDRNFRAYMISRSINYLGWMAFGFIAVYGIWRFDLPKSYSAIFAAVLSATSMIGYPLWGTIGDRFGHKRVLMLADFIWVGALVLLYFAPSVYAIYGVFGLIGLATTGDVIGDLNLAMEFGKIEDRPTYIGMARTLTAPMLLLAPVLAGSVVQLFDFQAMFIVSMVFALLGILSLWQRVKEPRLNGENIVMQ